MFCSASVEDLAAIFDDEDAQLTEMVPDDTKMLSHYYRSAIDELPLSVVYVAPSNPIRNRQQPPRGEVRPKFHEEPQTSEAPRNRRSQRTADIIDVTACSQGN